MYPDGDVLGLDAEGRSVNPQLQSLSLTLNSCVQPMRQ